MVLNEIYDKEYQIFDHDQYGVSPLSLVAMHHKENYYEYGPIKRAIYRYRYYDIHKHFGLSLTEFLALPREATETIYEVIAHENKRSSQEIDHLMQDIRQSREK